CLNMRMPALSSDVVARDTPSLPDCTPCCGNSLAPSPRGERGPRACGPSAPHRPPPAQRVLDLCFQPAQRLPVELAFGLDDGAYEPVGIAGSADAVDMGYRVPDELSDRFDHLPHAVACAGSEVERSVAAPVGLVTEQPSDGAQVGVGKVAHV